MITPNSYVDPYFYDKKAQEINTDLSALGWIQYIHPVAFIGVDSEGTFPEVYKNDGSKKLIRIYPTGNSLSFFEVESASQIDESEFYETVMGLVVWADLTNVYPSKDYNYTGELIKDIVGVLEGHSAYNLDIQLTDVFASYSQLEKLENQNTMLPYTAFRVNFTVSLQLCNA